VLNRGEAVNALKRAIYTGRISPAQAKRVDEMQAVADALSLMADLQPGEVVIAEKIDRISRLPLPEAERLVASIRAKGARLAVPGVVDLSDLAAEAQGVAKIVLESVQDMLLKLALQMARDDYEDRRERQRQGIELAKRDGRYKGRRADPKLRAQVIALRSIGQSIAETAKLAGCSVAQVKRIWASRDMSRAEAARHGAFVEDALTEADAGAAADVEQGAAELPEPAFLDDEGPSADLPAFIDTANIRSLYGWEPGETVEEAIARHRAKEGKTS